MSEAEQQPAGLESVEQSQGFTPMPMATPDAPRDDYEDLDGEALGAKEAGEELARRRTEGRSIPYQEPPPAAEPLHRDYVDVQSGKPRPANETLELDRAASDITQIRQAEHAAEQTKSAADLAEAIDRLRSGDTSQPDQPQEQPQHQPQPEQPQPAPESDVWQRPEVISAVTEYNNQINSAVQGLQQQYVNELATTAAQAAALFASIAPEFVGLQSAEQIQTALGVIERQDPQRGAQLRTHIGNVAAMASKAQEAQKQQIQQQSAQHWQAFDHVAKQADDAYDKWITQQEPDPGRRQEISATAQQMLREAGLSDQEMAYHWSTNPILRSVTGQQILADAARYRMSRQGVRTKLANPVAAVSRPGSPAERHSERDEGLYRLNAKLNSSHSAKDAAALLLARRAGRGR